MKLELEELSVSTNGTSPRILEIGITMSMSLE